MNILLESISKLNESDLDTSSNEYQALVSLKSKLRATGDGGLDFDPIEIDRRGAYEFAVRYWGDWKVPEGEEDDGDYDWKILTDASHERLERLVEEVSNTYKVKIEFKVGEKYWVYFTCTKPIVEAQGKLRYHYRGPVRHFDDLITDDWEGFTEAVSERQALNNLTIKAKKRFGYTLDSRVTLNPNYLELASGLDYKNEPAPVHREKCAHCGHDLNDAGECPVCDLGDESALEESKVCEDNRNPAKAFWDAAKNKIVDQKAFHAAYDKDIKEAGLEDIFDPQGWLRHKGVYGRIKELDPEGFLAKALKRFWALQFIDFAKTAEQVKAEAERKAKEEEEARQAAEKTKRDEEELDRRIKEFSDGFTAALDKDLLAQLKDLAPHPEEVKGPYIQVKNVSEVYDGVPSRWVGIRYDAGTGDPADYHMWSRTIQLDSVPTPEEVAEEFNKGYFPTLLTALKNRRSQGQADWIEPLNKWLKDNYNVGAVFVDESGKVFTFGGGHFTSIPWTRFEPSLDQAKGQLRLLGVSTSQSDAENSTYHDNVYDNYYSSNSSAPTAVLDQASIKGAAYIAKTPEHIGEPWGHQELHRYTEDEAEDERRFLTHGMDTWCWIRNVIYATD